MVESDSKSLISLIQDLEKNLRPLATLLHSCCSLMANFQTIKIKHTYIEANMIVDSLAKQNLGMNYGVVYLDFPPDHLTNLLLVDLCGIFFQKLVPDAEML